MSDLDNSNVTDESAPDRFALDPNLSGMLIKKFGHKKKLHPPRKNLYYVIQLINTFIDLKAETITSHELQQAVDELGWREKWNLNTDTIDDNGLRKELAGLIGGFGLRLAKVRSREANIYRLPKERIGDDHLKDVGINPDLVQAQAINPRILQAIRGRHPITFRYRDDPQTSVSLRKVNPHFYGNQSGNINIEGYQVAGCSSSGVPAWKVFRLDDMGDLRVATGEHFSTWPGYRRDHVKYRQPIEMI